MAFISRFSSPQGRQVRDGRKALGSDLEREGYDLAHSGYTFFRMRVEAERRVELLQVTLAEVEKSSSKVSQKKAAAVRRRIGQLIEAARGPAQGVYSDATTKGAVIE
jgi:hypothetical protein